MKKITAKIAIKSLFDDGYALTANQIAKMTSYTPQHINSVLRSMYFEREAAFAILPHQGRVGFARKWCSPDKVGEHPELEFQILEF